MDDPLDDNNNNTNLLTGHDDGGSGNNDPTGATTTTDTNNTTYDPLAVASPTVPDSFMARAAAAAIGAAAEAIGEYDDEQQQQQQQGAGGNSNNNNNSNVGQMMTSPSTAAAAGVATATAAGATPADITSPSTAAAADNFTMIHQTGGGGGTDDINTTTTNTTNSNRKRPATESSTTTAADESMSPMKKVALSELSTCRPVTVKRCKVEGCEKVRVKNGYCTRHNKDPNAAIRGPAGVSNVKKCDVEGCERFRSKGPYCHRHSKDISAPIRNPTDPRPPPAPVVKKPCKVENCTRLSVKRGFCSRHFKNKDAPVLTAPPFSFIADDRWDELFPQLEEFAKKNGHARVPTSDRTSDLARFVVHIRSVYRNKKMKMVKSDTPSEAVSEDVAVPDLGQSTLLTPERMEALKSINFEFQLWTVDTNQWEKRFSELIEYKKEHGNYNVTFKQNATLSSWCKTQRQRYKNTMAVYQGMYNVPMIESLKTSKGEALYKRASEKSSDITQAGGTVYNVTIDKFCQAKEILDPEKILKLTAIGFEWELQKESYAESWEKRFNELMNYKLLNGNCRVPKATTEYPQLGHWVKQMRKYRSWKDDGKPYPSTFTDERIRRLDQLGFEWRLKEAPGSGSMRKTMATGQNQATQPIPALPMQPAQMVGVPAMAMVDPNQQVAPMHNGGVHNPAAFVDPGMNMNMNVNVNDPARQFEMDPNQYQHQQYHGQQHLI